MGGADSGICLDNMQRQRGPPGLYGCHGGASQRWLFKDGYLTSPYVSDVCLGHDYQATLHPCRPKDVLYQWDHMPDKTLRPRDNKDACLARIDEHTVRIDTCNAVDGRQWWRSMPWGS